MFEKVQFYVLAYSISICFLDRDNKLFSATIR